MHIHRGQRVANPRAQVHRRGEARAAPLHRRALNVRKLRRVSLVLEHLRQHLAPTRQAGPRKVSQHDSVLRHVLRPPQHRRRVGRRHAVHHDLPRHLRDLPEFRHLRQPRTAAPHDQRQVGHRERQDHRLQIGQRRVRRGDFHLLAANLPPLSERHPALRVNPLGQRTIARAAEPHQNSARRVLRHEPRNSLSQALRVFAGFGQHQQGHGAGAQHARAAFRLPLLAAIHPQRGQFLEDLLGSD